MFMHRMLIAFFLMFMTCQHVDAQTRDVDALDAAVGHLQSGIRGASRGDDFAMLFSLRQLADESTRPLFHQLVKHRQWHVQVHAVLALAEIGEAQGEDPATIDHWLVTQCDSQGHDTLITTAIDLDLLPEKTINELLRWEDLAPSVRILLQAELVFRNLSLTRESLERVIGNGDIRIAGLAACLAAQGGDQTPFSSVRERLANMPRRDRHAVLRWLFEAIGQYRLTAMVPWIEEQLEDDESFSSGVMAEAVYALLQCDAERGKKWWHRYLGSEPRPSRVLLAGLMYLNSEAPMSADVRERLQGHSPVSDAFAHIGEAQELGAPLSEPLKQLFLLDHLRSNDWVMRTIETLSETERHALYEFIIERGLKNEAGKEQRAMAAVQAAQRLFMDKPSEMARYLGKVEDDSTAQEILLLAMLNTQHAEAGVHASSLRRIGSGRADSMALLIIARHVEELNDRDIAQLGMIASGGGRLSSGLQSQAAWLYLKHTNNINSALARLFPH